VSGIPADWHDQLNIREQIARIDRDQAEIHKLLAEASKFRRERWLVPVTAVLAVLAAIVARLPELLHAFGVGG